MPPMAGLADWQVTLGLSRALGYEMHYEHPSEIMAEIAALTPTFTNVTYERLDQEGSLQWPCNDAAPNGTPIMHIDEFVRGKGYFALTEYVATDEKVTPAFPITADHRTYSVAIQCWCADSPYRQCFLACPG